MAFWNEGRHRGRLNLDDMARSGDTSLNLLVVLLLIAALAAGWWTYGHVTPAVDIATPSSTTRVAPTVSPTLPAPDTTTAKPTPAAPSPSTTP
jgi:hypothetical protein